MQNYFNYFTEIEERFQQRRGSILMLSTLDWALIDAWREAGVPLAVVLRGIDDAFDKYEVRAAKAKNGKGRLRKVNGLAWAAQSVMAAAEVAVDAQTGLAASSSEGATAGKEDGFEAARIADYLLRNADALASAHPALSERLRELAAAARTKSAGSLEELDRTLSVLEEKLVAAVIAATPLEELAALREQAARELAPYRGKMGTVQIRQVEAQMMHKRLLGLHTLPRLSLFYMTHGESR